VKVLASSLDKALEEQQALLLLIVGEGTGEGSFTLVGPPALVNAANFSVAAALEGRIGGKGWRYQGKCQKLGAPHSLLPRCWCEVILCSTLRADRGPLTGAQLLIASAMQRVSFD